MNTNRKESIRILLKGIETGDPESVKVVNEAKYIQHNPQTVEGSEGLAALFARLAQTNPRVNVVRIFQDGDFVFGHTEYDFSTSRVGFEVFRFEGDQAVEHWDNIQKRAGPNPSARSMVDGPTEVMEREKTEANRETVRLFATEVLIKRQLQQLGEYFDGDQLTQHDPTIADGVAALRAALTSRDDHTLYYDGLHRLLAEGNFVLAACEGHRNKTHVAIYDLYRLEEGKLVEHWNTIEAIAPREHWKNNNGKF